MPRIQRGVIVDYDIWNEARTLGISPTDVIDDALKLAIARRKAEIEQVKQ